jgi:head-tail adaptor
MDSDGNTVEDWAVVYRALAAEVLTGPGREGTAAGTLLGETDIRVTLRWFPELGYADRLVWDGSVYSLVEILTDKTARADYRLRAKKEHDYLPISSSSSTPSGDAP